MFNEDEDWNDAQDVQVLEKSGPENTPKAKSSSNMKSKVVGKKSLLRTLQTLGSVPDWESNSRQQDSDSEAEAAPAHKKRKKRRKRRKQAEKSEEQEENVDGVVKEDAAGPKKKKKGNKFGVPNSNGVDAGKKKNEENPASEQVDAKIPANTDKISRQQWKNKMKNKRKSKNKYRQSKAVEDDKEKDDKQESKAEVKPESQSKNTSESISLRAPQKKKMERQCKPPKRKHPEEDPPVPEARQQKAEKLQKSVKAEKRVHEPPAERSKQKAAQLQQELPDNQPQLPPKRFELSREQSLKRQKMQRMLLRQEESPPVPPPGGAEPEPEPAPAGGEEESPAAAPSRSDALRSRMEQRLEAARFRYINELLYSTSSGEARRMFQQDPNAFWVYHKGYTAQVQRWPANPVDAIISFIRQKPSSLVVADFGCGDCKIARSVKNKVHSFDLASTCELVTVCDMASVPLGDGSVDIAVFCLSLMGTNLADFLTEANRVLKTGGFLKIAEVASRFDNDRNFVSSLANLGFKLVSKDTENSHFYSFDFVKTGNAPKNVKKYGLQLKPCLYKKR